MQSSECVDAALRVCEARSTDEVLRALPVPVTGYRLWSEVMQLSVLRRQGPSAAWEVLERAWARREECPRDPGELADPSLLVGWLELDTDALVRALCDGARMKRRSSGPIASVRDALDATPPTTAGRSRTRRRSRGDRAVARKLCESIGGVVRFAPLLVEDWARATMPEGGTADDQLWWTILALEAHLGRSAALRDGFGLRR